MQALRDANREDLRQIRETELELLEQEGAREAVLQKKWQMVVERGIVPEEDLPAYWEGIKSGFGDGVRDGLGGMAYDAGSFAFQLNPLTRVGGLILTGEDVGKEEEAALRAFEQSTKQAIKNAPHVAAQVALDVAQVRAFVNSEGNDLLDALARGDQTYIARRVADASPLIQETMETAQSIMTEIGIFLVDHTDAETAGYIVGQILYEVAEDVALTAATGAFTAATGGAGSAPSAATVMAIKAVRMARLMHRLEKRGIFKAKILVKALQRLQDSALWMAKWKNICFVAGTPVHTPGGQRNIEDIQPRRFRFCLDRKAARPMRRKQSESSTPSSPTQRNCITLLFKRARRIARAN